MSVPISGGGALLPQHRDMLKSSGIPDDVIETRGYRSIRDPRELEEMYPQLAKTARTRTPGLYIPMHRCNGTQWGYQYRPDHPRERHGKLVKYETPQGQATQIDFPKMLRGRANPKVDLYITEGAKKADAAVGAGLCCIALTGVWNWRRKVAPAVNATIAVPDWADLALQNRTVVIAFDGDVQRKPEVRRAMGELARYLGSKGSTVRYLHLPDTDEKTGLDDYLAEHGVDELKQLVRFEMPPEAGGEPPARTPVGRARHWPTIDGAGLLNRVEEAIRRHCVLPDDDAITTAVLWTAATHFVDLFDYAPRLIIRSATKRSGKTRLLEVVEGMAWNPLPTANTSTAALFRSLDSEKPPTVMFDETDAIFGTRKASDAHEELRGILNAGFQRGKPVRRVDKDTMQVVEFPVFAFCALSGIGRLPDTIEDRAVIITVKRRKKNEAVKPFRLRRDLPPLVELREELAAWAEQNRAKVEGAEPADMGVEDRVADTWEPLIAVADAAHPDWGRRARQAAQAANGRTDSGGTQEELLRDIRAVWENHYGVSFLKSTVLVSELVALPDSAWSDLSGEHYLSAHGLARRLGEFGVKPRQNDARTERGYHRSDFLDAFERWL
ncbi:DUF3631 domain-containing protein [Lolliginicoccus suaedae]|uniref:DUF3631 domain-containing protein n=1 Tax=Lolliginicoccus suaedae TaxID=2605429 RepID=UPI0011F04B45|nr:DUF3631 domain-containing protein [Lolliginicoccus suaedae]